MIIAHNLPGEIFSFDLCEVEISEKASLSIHVSKKHKELDQLDGNNSDVEDTYSEEYWEKDNMGQTYKRYLDVIKSIYGSNLSNKEKEKKKRKSPDRKKKMLTPKRVGTKKQIEIMPPWDTM